jgi:hypothetical protein
MTNDGQMKKNEYIKLIPKDAFKHPARLLQMMEEGKKYIKKVVPTDTCEICGKTRQARGNNGDFNYANHMCDDCYCHRTYGNADEKKAYLASIGRPTFDPIPSIQRYHLETRP